MSTTMNLHLIGLMVLVVALFPESSIAQEIENQQSCSPSSCGKIGNISFPFHLKGNPPSCGDGYHELACENNRTTLYFFGFKYFVQNISYENQTIRLVDANINNHYCSIPHNSFPFSEFDYELYASYIWPHSSVIFFVSCARPVSSLNYVDFSSCININSSSTSSSSKSKSKSKTNSSSYVVLDVSSSFDIHVNCTVNLVYPFIEVSHFHRNLTISDIHQGLLQGFQLSFQLSIPSWLRSDHKQTVLQRLEEFLDSLLNDIIIHAIKTAGVYILTVRISIGLLCLIIMLAYRFRQRHLSIDDTIENFLQSQNNFMPIRLLRFIILLAYRFRRELLSIDDTIENFLQIQNNFMPIRYSYSDIKQMTRNFRDKLGQGGYGSVFKGKLRCGDLVAIKVLGKSKANGQDFINEVATIGRIHHINVVRMIGFCVEGSKRALVYDFMPNGSLDKFIFLREEENLPFISWERMHKIAVGVARGIEYLHRGCDMQILHFDIKPHNILLDEDFVPKVSDFGLAKLYPTDDSIVSLTAARGTFGYIAPELFYKNIGRVSYKADVYSFGMLLMEMVGKRKNLNAHAEHTSQIYFPYWIYDHINQGDDLQLGGVIEQEKSSVKKMIIAALWCIQLKPVDRPSMSEVLEMLEGEEELLQMPPKPFLYSNDISMEDQEDNNPIGEPTSSHAEMSITLEDMLR